MHTAVRPFAASGVVALVGAGFIAATPIVAPPLATTIEHAATQLTASSNPFSAYGAVFEKTVDNLQSIFTTAAANGPTPILSAVYQNQVAALKDILSLLSPTAGAQPTAATPTAGAAVASAAVLPSVLQTTLGQIFSGITAGAPPLLASALQDLLHGNVEDAVNQVLLAGLTVLLPATNLIAPVLNGIAHPLQLLVNAVDKLGPLATILANPVQNVVNVISALNASFLGLPGAPSNLVTALGGVLGPLIQAPSAAGAAVQGIIDAARAGNLGAVVKAIVSVPAVIVGGILNGGYGPDLSSVIKTGLDLPLFGGGLLTQFAIAFTNNVLSVNLAGTIPALQTLQKLIADALKPPKVTTKAPAAAAATTAVTQVPDAGATTVTLATTDTKAAAAETPKTAEQTTPSADTPKDTAPTEATATKPAADDTTAAEPVTSTPADTDAPSKTDTTDSSTKPDTKPDTKDAKPDTKGDTKGDSKGGSAASGSTDASGTDSTNSGKPRHTRGGGKHSTNGGDSGSQGAGGAGSTGAAGSSTPKHAKGEHHAEHTA